MGKYMISASYTAEGLKGVLAEVAAAVLTVGASCSSSVRTTVLLTADQIDAAVKHSPSYRAPGA